MKDFYIDKFNPNTKGPFIFASRLKDELEEQGLSFSADSKNRLSIISGAYQEGANNMLRLDGLYLDSLNTKGKSRLLNKRIYKCYKKFDHIVFQSEFCKNCYESFTGKEKPNSVIYNGAPEYFFKECDTIDKPEGFEKVVIASSKWRRHKRVEEAIMAFKSPKLKDVALVILGGYKNVSASNIFSLPKIKPKKLPSYLQMADAMIHLSWLDWCPNSVVEGLASRLPVLCTHNGGTKELVKDDGVVIELEETYEIGKNVPLYKPPKVDVDIIVDGVLKLIEMPKIAPRDDLKISNTALSYSKLFK
jgi:glycosyltransferase involved in cell wall biosynthesis